MKYKNFEDYLAAHFAENSNALDDDLQEATEDWIARLDTSRVIDFADAYAQEIIKELDADVQKIINQLEK